MGIIINYMNNVFNNFLNNMSNLLCAIVLLSVIHFTKGMYMQLALCDFNVNYVW